MIGGLGGSGWRYRPFTCLSCCVSLAAVALGSVHIAVLVFCRLQISWPCLACLGMGASIVPHVGAVCCANVSALSRALCCGAPHVWSGRGRVATLVHRSPVVSGPPRPSSARADGRLPQIRTGPQFDRRHCFRPTYPPWPFWAPSSFMAACKSCSSDLS